MISILILCLVILFGILSLLRLYRETNQKIKKNTENLLTRDRS
ncbi:hypothetical protein STRUR_0977 [Streptococcus urinalis 2285-97]|uniref:Uncharacterized protein n=1 Tax=Streptococcus urinalis 2285-97 TaxID=764291 RepID=G5KFD4_9STRE|nr:hypothetical protein STRUR_0977 [Streptococcus urinalis 2285-97]